MRRLNGFLSPYLPSAKLLMFLFLLMDIIQLIYFIRAAHDGRIAITIEVHRHYCQ